MTRGWWLASALALVLVLGHVFGDGPFHLTFPMLGASADAFGTVWMYDWVHDQVVSGHFPLSTDQMYAPSGVDFLVRNGANVLDAVLAVPFEALFGRAQGRLWFAVVLVAGNFVAFFPLARRLAPNSPGAVLLATSWFACNPFVLSELQGGRPTQAMLWFVPPAIGALWRLEGRKDAVILGLCLGLQGLTYWYLPVFFVLVLGPYMVAQVWEEPRRAFWLGLAVLVAVAVVSPLAVPIVLAARAGEIPGLDLELEKAGTWSEFSERSRRLYVQLGMISTTAVLAAVVVRVRRAPALAFGVAAALCFALGARFGVLGSPVKNLPFIWLYEHVSLVARLRAPARVLAVVYPVAAAALVPVLAANRTRWLPWLFAGLAVLETRANHLSPGMVLSLPELPAAVVVRMNPGVIVTTPIGAADVAMAEQSFHHQALLTGMGDHLESVRPKKFARWLDNPWFAEVVQADDLMAPWSEADKAELAAAARWVWFDRMLLARGTDSRLTETIESRLAVALGDPYYQDSYTTLWDLTRPGETASVEEKAAAVEADAVLVREHERASAGPGRGVLWSWGEGSASEAARRLSEEKAEQDKAIEAAEHPEAEKPAEENATPTEAPSP